MAKIRVGLAGLGLVSDSHAQGYLRHESAEITALCDLDRAVAEHKAGMWQASKVYTDFDRMLKDPEIDAVDITALAAGAGPPANTIAARRMFDFSSGGRDNEVLIDSSTPR